jgi:hypothetical protein
MIYTHVLNRGGRGVKSPVDTLCPAAAYTAGSCRVSHLSRTGGTLEAKDLMMFYSRLRVVLTDMSPYVELAAAPEKVCLPTALNVAQELIVGL